VVGGGGGGRGGRGAAGVNGLTPFISHDVTRRSVIGRVVDKVKRLVGKAKVGDLVVA